MSDILLDIADAADALTNPYSRSEPRWEWDANRNKKPLPPHRTTIPGLVQQLRELAEEGTAGDSEGGTRSVPGSRPPGAFDAISLVTAITFGAAWRLTNPIDEGGLGLNGRGSAEADIRAIVGAAPQAPSDVQRDIRAELQSWRRQAEVLTGWEQPPVSLTAPCPVVDVDGAGTACGARGLLAKRDGTGARCTACGATWSEANVGLLFDHVRAYLKTSQASADAARLRVREAKEVQRQRVEDARDARRNAA